MCTFEFFNFQGDIQMLHYIYMNIYFAPSATNSVSINEKTQISAVIKLKKKNIKKKNEKKNIYGQATARESINAQASSYV